MSSIAAPEIGSGDSGEPTAPLSTQCEATEELTIGRPNTNDCINNDSNTKTEQQQQVAQTATSNKLSSIDQASEMDGSGEQGERNQSCGDGQVKNDFICKSPLNNLQLKSTANGNNQSGLKEQPIASNSKSQPQHQPQQQAKQIDPQNTHVCRLCDKLLSSSSSLDRHMLTHSGERPFVCKRCHMTFTTNGNMHRHMRTHLHKDSLARQQQEQQQQQIKSLSGGASMQANSLAIGSPIGQHHKQLVNSSDRSPPAIASLAASFPFANYPSLATSIEQQQQQHPHLQLPSNIHQANPLQQQVNRLQNRHSPFIAPTSSAASDPTLVAPIEPTTATSVSALLSHPLVAALQQQLPKLRSRRGGNIQQQAFGEPTVNPSKPTQAINLDLVSQMSDPSALHQLDPKASFMMNALQGDQLGLESVKAVLLAAAAAAQQQSRKQLNNQSPQFARDAFQNLLDDQQQQTSVGKFTQSANSDHLDFASSQDEPEMFKSDRCKRRKQVHPRAARQYQSSQSVSSKQALSDDFDGQSEENFNEDDANGDQFETEETGVFSKRDVNANMKLNNDEANDEDDEQQSTSLMMQMMKRDIEDLNNNNQERRKDPSPIQESLFLSLNKRKDQQNQGEDLDDEEDFDHGFQSQIEHTGNSASLINSTNDLSMMSDERELEDSMLIDEEQDGYEDDEQDEEDDDDEFRENRTKRPKVETGNEDSCDGGTVKGDQLSTNFYNKQNSSFGGVSDETANSNSSLREASSSLSSSSKTNSRSSQLASAGLNVSSRVGKLDECPTTPPIIGLTGLDGEIIEDISQSYVKTANPHATRKGGKRNRHCYKCKLCTYSSVDRCTLVRHLRIHSGERPYICGICRYAFTTKANCERHVRKRHKKQYNSLGGSGGVKGSNGGGRSLIITDHSNHQTIPVRVNPAAAETISQTLQRIQEKTQQQQEVEIADQDDSVLQQQGSILGDRMQAMHANINTTSNLTMNNNNSININHNDNHHQMRTKLDRTTTTSNQIKVNQLTTPTGHKSGKRKHRSNFDSLSGKNCETRYQRQRLSDRQQSPESNQLFQASSLLQAAPVEAHELLLRTLQQQQQLYQQQPTSTGLQTETMSGHNELIANLVAQIQQASNQQRQQQVDQQSASATTSPAMNGHEFLASLLAKQPGPSGAAAFPSDGPQLQQAQTTLGSFLVPKSLSQQIAQLRQLGSQSPFFLKRKPFDPFNPLDLAVQALDLSCKFQSSK